MDASGAAGQPTRVRVFGAGTASRLRELTGGFAWPAEPDLTIAAGPSPTEVAVVGRCMVSVPDGHTLQKATPAGGTETLPSISWRAFRAVEVFNITTGALITSAAPNEIELGTTTQFAKPG